MGIIKRVKAAPRSLRDGLTDALDNGGPGAILNLFARFGENNADARKTIGEDVLR